MNTEIHIQEENLRDWWRYQRRKLNRGLLLSAAATFLLCGFIASVVVNPFKDYEFIGLAMLLFVTANLMYAGFVNLFVFVVSLIDRAYSQMLTQSLRVTLFTTGYWLVIALNMLSFVVGACFVFGVGYGHVL